MSLRYRLLYRLGITPWDRDDVAPELVALVAGPAALAPGRALDLGCGTGTEAVYLAQHGWEVTGIDAVQRPLAAARWRAQGAGVSVEWLRADVVKLATLDLKPGFELIHDRGCFHELSAASRQSYADGVTDLAAPGARLMLMTFAPGHRLAAPAGADEEEVRARFPRWGLEVAMPDSGPDPSGPMRNVPRTWYCLMRE